MVKNSTPSLKRGLFGTIVVSALTLVFILILPITVLLILLAASFRTIIKTYVKHFRTDYGKIMPLRSTIFTTEVPGENSKNSLFHVFILKGSVDFNKLKKDILEKVLQKNESGDLNYPELQQSVAVIAGYSFWKWDRNFDINNHVHLGHNGSTRLTSDDMNSFVATTLRNPHLRSPWEVFVFPEYIDCSEDGQHRSAILIRFNHALADAFSILYIIANAAGAKLPARTSRNTGKSPRKRFTSRLVKILRTPYDALGGIYDTWDGRCLTVDEPSTLVSRFSDPIPMSLIKDLKNKLGVSFGGILAATYTGGLRKLIGENNIKSPKILHVYTPMPMLGHKDKLRNRMKLGYIVLPVGISDPLIRLKIAEEHLKSIAKSRLSGQVYYIIGIIGLFPNFFIKFTLKYMSLSGMITNFPFPVRNLSYNGHVVEQMMGAHGIFPRNVGISVTTASFEESVIIQTNYLKSSLLNGNEEVFHNGILEELNVLTDLANSGSKSEDIV